MNGPFQGHQFWHLKSFQSQKSLNEIHIVFLLQSSWTDFKRFSWTFWLEIDIASTELCKLLLCWTLSAAANNTRRNFKNMKFIEIVQNWTTQISPLIQVHLYTYIVVLNPETSMHCNARSNSDISNDPEHNFAPMVFFCASFSSSLGALESKV